MANIATVFVRIVGRPALSDVEILSILLAYNLGNSYCVPIQVEYANGHLELQYGAKDSPGTAVHRLWEAGVKDAWVRFLDEGGDFDSIAPIGDEASMTYQWCRYGFDAIEAEIGGVLERHEIVGSYQGGNARSTAARRSSPAGHVEPEPVAAICADLRARASALRYFWKGRLVRVASRVRDGWSDVGLDGWDNCVDPLYLASAAGSG